MNPTNIITSSILIALVAWSDFGLSDEFSTITMDYSENSGRETSANDSVRTVINNRFLAAGFNSGIAELNKSIDSLMANLFYSIMDQDFSTPLTDSVAMDSSIERTVHATSIGGSVVVDKFVLGPDILKPLGKMGGLPLAFHNQAKLFVTNATHRSDALRKSEQSNQSFWRDLVANWFGILPLLTRLLPPSFNAEELYDPARYLQTPFIFPRNTDEALKMPLGTIRSYGLSGSSSFDLSFLDGLSHSLRSSINANQANLKIPLSAFKDGEHRISLLRRGENKIWLSLSEIRRIGAKLSSKLERNFVLLNTAFKWWKGANLPIFPLDFELSQIKTIRTDELFEFDLSNQLSHEAFNKAIGGDFSLVRKSRADASPFKESIKFLLHRLTTKDEAGQQRRTSLYVTNNQKISLLSWGKSSTETPNGSFKSLDASYNSKEQDWNVLVGGNSADFSFEISIPTPSDQNRNNQTNPAQVSSDGDNFYARTSLHIVDKFVDSREYSNLVDSLRKFSGLSLDDMPEIPLIETDQLDNYFKQKALSNPLNEIEQQELVPTHLGKIEAIADVYIPHAALEKIYRLPRQNLWRAAAKAHGMDEELWMTQSEHRGLPFYTNLTTSYLLLPFNLANISLKHQDLAREVTRLEGALNDLGTATDPHDLLAAYKMLFNTNHPLELVNTFFNLMAPGEMVSLVALRTDAHKSGSASPLSAQTEKNFAAINGKIYKSPGQIPVKTGSKSVDDVIIEFESGQFETELSTQKIKKITLTLNEADRNTLSLANKRLIARLETNFLRPKSGILSTYIRVEQNQAVNLGRFVLAEEIGTCAFKEETASNRSSNEENRSCQFDIISPDGLRDRAFFDDALLKGGRFDFFFSISTNEQLWSPEVKMSFALENGRLELL